MRKLLFIAILSIACNAHKAETASTNKGSYASHAEQVKSDSMMMDIQSKIHGAFAQDMISKEYYALKTLSAALEGLYQERKNNLVLYWRSYLQFYASLIYLEKGDRESSEREIDQGIDWMKAMKNKHSEDYALLSLLEGFGIQFKGIMAMFIAGDIKDHARTAIAMDSTNLRGYYVYASNDFYTPEKYGGGKEAEKYLLKAISLQAQHVKNVYLPSWGKEEAYTMLINMYIRKEQWELAEKYFQEGVEKFPKSYTINQLAAKLIGK